MPLNDIKNHWFIQQVYPQGQHIVNNYLYWDFKFKFLDIGHRNKYNQ